MQLLSSSAEAKRAHKASPRVPSCWRSSSRTLVLLDPGHGQTAPAGPWHCCSHQLPQQVWDFFPLPFLSQALPAELQASLSQPPSSGRTLPHTPLQPAGSAQPRSGLRQAAEGCETTLKERGSQQSIWCCSPRDVKML